MPVRTTSPLHARLLARCALAVAAALALAGCGGDPGPARTVVVTTDPTTSSATTSAAPEQTGPTSDVADRAHDIGTIADVEDVDGTTVLTLDRWTYADWSEQEVADEGVPLAPLTEDPFRNQNSDSTYAVPVSPDVVVGLNSCEVGTDQEPRIATTAGDVDDLVAGDTIWLLTYRDGLLVQADTAAFC